jgi:hypothetical protein
VGAPARVAQANALSVAPSRGEDKGKGRANSLVNRCARNARACATLDARTDRDRSTPQTSVQHMAQRLRHVAGVSDRYRVSTSVRASISGDGLVLLDVSGGLMLSSNSVGGRIWQLVERRLTCDEIVQEVSLLFDIPIDRASHDVTAFISALASRGLITMDNSC